MMTQATSLRAVPLCLSLNHVPRQSDSAEMSKCTFTVLIDVQECGLTAKKMLTLDFIVPHWNCHNFGVNKSPPILDFTKAVATIFSRAQRAGRSQLSGACGENTPSKNVVWN